MTMQPMQPMQPQQPAQPMQPSAQDIEQELARRLQALQAQAQRPPPSRQALLIQRLREAPRRTR